MTITTRSSEDGDRIWLTIDGRDVAYARVEHLVKLNEVERQGDYGPRELWCNELPYVPRANRRFE